MKKAPRRVDGGHQGRAACQDNNVGCAPATVCAEDLPPSQHQEARPNRKNGWVGLPDFNS
ncbi:hypothetical protein [Hymenobacter roseosalivarius]|uniref:hypothetical protein n=1 Tax=Hymenobacter roseosalivarius TaxID=89967 RepID=UPI00117B3B09|nr:hypothetical protein [Hymenobacter roseosalivarius]